MAEPTQTTQKVNWAEIESDLESEDEGKLIKVENSKQPVSKKPVFKPIKKEYTNTEVKKKETKITKNVFECEDLEPEEDLDEKEDKPKGEKKDNALSELLKVQKKEIPKTATTLSKKEQKKKELEELDKILGELGLNPQEQALAQAQAQEAKKKKKKEKKLEETQKNEEQVEKPAETQNLEEKQKQENKTDLNNNENEVIDKEKALQLALKRKVEAGKEKKTGGLKLDSAKQEILARQQKDAKKKKPKKVYEDQ